MAARTNPVVNPTGSLDLGHVDDAHAPSQFAILAHQAFEMRQLIAPIESERRAQRDVTSSDRVLELFDLEAIGLPRAHIDQIGHALLVLQQVWL